MPDYRSTRRLRRVGSACVAGVVTALAVPAAPAVASTINVPCSTVALIAAMLSAGPGDVLNLSPACLYSVTSAFSGEDGLPPVTNPDLTIHGNAAVIERATGSAGFRLFDIASGGILNMDNLTVTGGSTATDGGGILVQNGGNLTTDAILVKRSRTTQRGGGVGVETGGSADLHNSRVFNNSSVGAGGGIDAEGNVTLLQTTVDLNRAQGGGGGVNTDPGAQQLLIANSTVKNNVGQTSSGGIDLGGGITTINGTSIVDNSAPNGAFAGGIYNGPASTLQISASAIAGNTATANSAPAAGGLRSDGFTTINGAEITKNIIVGQQGTGGGIAQLDGTLTLNNVDVTENLASGQSSVGGGIFSQSADGLFLNFSHVDSNKVTGQNSSAAGIHNDTTPVTLTNSTVHNNNAVISPGGIWTNVAFTLNGINTVSGNTPSNCLNSPVVVCAG
ncbi:hypothetical protein [Streptomyces sp. NPDC086787]|uniref:hypothetical protein n=1 Tax=Streptomyces sp. NPDC086787 TaxID=3365759 RepID=UPI00382EB4E2